MPADDWPEGLRDGADGLGEGRRGGEPADSSDVAGVRNPFSGFVRVPFDLSIFNQGDLWVDEYGWEYRTEQMSGRERAVLVRWLRSNARHFYAQVLRAELARVVIRAEGRRQIGQQDVDLPELVYRSADDWMDGTMLMLRLTGSPDASPVSSSKRRADLIRIVLHRRRTSRRSR